MSDIDDLKRAAESGTIITREDVEAIYSDSIESVVSPGGYRILGLSNSDFDDNGFINNWGPITWQNNVFTTELTVTSLDPTNIEQSSLVASGSVGVYAEIIDGTDQYAWDLAGTLNTFILYSPVQNFSATYPAVGLDEHDSYSTTLKVEYSDEELAGLGKKFGTLPTSDTAKTHIISKTKEMANQIAQKRKRKLTFTKATNKQQLTTADFYSIQTAEINSQVSVDIASTTGSFNRPAESQTSGRTTYSSYGGSSY